MELVVEKVSGPSYSKLWKGAPSYLAEVYEDDNIMNARLVRRWAALILFEAGIKSLQLKDYDVSS
jgi:hypothetical protein